MHLGCGSIDHPKFINVDGAYYPHVHFVRRLEDLSCFPDDYADFIHASHCLEHFAFTDVMSVLVEWRRVLKVGGVLRISVPSFDALIDAYLKSGRNADLIQPYLMGGQGNDYNVHGAIFNEESLATILRAARFRVVRTWSPGEGAFPDLVDTSRAVLNIGERAVFISLNLEAVK